MSVYDGCITIILSNGTIVAQGGVVYDYCKGLQVTSLTTSHLLPTTSYLTSLTSHPLPHISYLLPLTSHLLYLTLYQTSLT